jgi:hypothetical protein
MSYSRRELYAMGEPLGESVTRKEGGRIIYGGGGGGGSSTNTQTQVVDLPEWAKPTAQKQLGLAESVTNINQNPYQSFGGIKDSSGRQVGFDPSKVVAGMDPMQQRAYQGVGSMQVPGQFGQGMDITGAGVRGAFGTAGQGVGLSNLGYETAGLGQQALGYGRQAARAGDRYAMQATNPYATQAYMSPYMQNVVDAQNREAIRSSQIAGTQQQADATRVGAFGGSRDAIMRAERERNLSTLMNQNQAQGLQNAFQQAPQAQQFGANLGLQGLQAGMQGVQTGVQGMQTGMQGVGAGIGAQQAAYNQAMQGGQQMANLGQQQLASQQGIYNLQNQFGGQQQAQQQALMNAEAQNFAAQQRYPYQNLEFMSNILRGTPMGTVQSMYAPQPGIGQQALGAGTSLAGAYMVGGGKFADGGYINAQPAGLAELAISKM